MKIALCEDNKQDVLLFKNFCELYCRNNQKQIEIAHFPSGEDFLEEFRAEKYDAIFLDIYMNKLTGIETARKIREVDEDVKIIFTTTSSEHYGDGFAVEATHYLIKPLTEEKIEQAMHRLRNLFKENEVMLSLSSGTKIVEIPQSSIICIETIRNGIEVHCKNEVFAVRTSLSNAIEQLTDSCFLQSHRFSVINLNEVVSISEDDFIMSNGKHILIRKANKKEIEQEYHKFQIRNLRGELK